MWREKTSTTDTTCVKQKQRKKRKILSLARNFKKFK